jgi:hypothetical protein
MPYTVQGLPFAKDSHESYQAAVRAASTRETKTAAYLKLLARRGPLTDHEARAALGLPLSSICSIRNGAKTCGLVEKGAYAKPSPLGGNPCRVWQLSEAGRAVVVGGVKRSLDETSRPQGR